MAMTTPVMSPPMDPSHVFFGERCGTIWCFPKNMRKIKDFGHIFPGHGGVLDRFDSVIFVAPFAEFLFRIVF